MSVQTRLLAACLLLFASTAAAQTDREALAALRDDLARVNAVIDALLAKVQPSAVVLVEPGDDLQAAIDDAPAGSRILLRAGDDRRGARFRLTKPVTIEPFAVLPATVPATLTPDGVTVYAPYVPLLPRFQSPDGEPVFTLGPDADDVVLRGLRIHGAPVHTRNALIEIGSPTATRVEDQPHRVRLDQLLLEGLEDRWQRNGINVHGVDVELRLSAILGIKYRADESHGVYVNNTPGPLRFVGNVFEAASIGVLFGGDRQRIPGSVTCDIAIEGNTFTKRLLWRGAGFSVKNHLEFKQGCRWRVAGNVFGAVWPDGMDGFAFLGTVKPQYFGTDQHIHISDGVLEGNIFRGAGSGLKFAGMYNECHARDAAGTCTDWRIHESRGAWNITVRNNLLALDRAANPARLAAGLCGQLSAVRAFQFVGNTCLTQGTRWFYTHLAADPTVVNPGGVFTRNVVLSTSGTYYGFSGEGATSNAIDTLAFYYPGGTLTDNVLARHVAARTPTGNLLPTLDELKAAFVDFDGGDYRIRPESPFAGYGWRAE